MFSWCQALHMRPLIYQSRLCSSLTLNETETTFTSHSPVSSISSIYPSIYQFCFSCTDLSNSIHASLVLTTSKIHHGKTCLRGYLESKGCDQSTHPRGLKLAFPIRFQINRQTVHVCVRTLWKHAYSNILKILPSKNENFQIKKFWYLSYFCSKHRLWVHVRTASSGQT